MTTLLLDYGCVICLPQSEDAIAALESAVPGVAPSEFWLRYWDLRLDYDRGLADSTYWSAVLGREATPEESLRLTALDIEGWSRLDERMTDLIVELSGRGVRIGLLSNAPTTMSRAIEKAPWTSTFSALTFSADLGVAKPERAAYDAAARALDVPAGDVLFVDDRSENVAGVHAAGMSALHYTGFEDALPVLRERLLG